MIDVAMRLGLKGGTEVERALKAIGQEGKTSLREIREAARGLPPSMVAVSRSVAGLKDSVSNLAMSAPAGLGQIAGSFGMVGTAATAAGVLVGVAAVAMVRMGLAALAAADDLEATAARIGVGAEELQKLRFAAEEVDIPVAELDTALQALNGTLGKLRIGEGDGRIKGFAEKLGLTPEFLATVDDASELLPVLADHISKIKSTSDQVAFAKAFGIEALLPLMREGSEGMAKLEKLASRLGLALSDDLVGGAADADRKLEVLNQTIGVRMDAAFIHLSELVLGPIPNIEALATKFEELDRRGRQSVQNFANSMAKIATFFENISSSGSSPVSRLFRGPADFFGDLAAGPDAGGGRRGGSGTPQGPGFRGGYSPPRLYADDDDKPKSKSGAGEAERKAREAQRKKEVAERQAELLEEIKLQNQLEVAKARGAQHLVDLLEEQLAVRALANRYEQAGLDEVNARLEAEKQIAALRWAQSIRPIDTSTPEGFESSKDRMKTLHEPFQVDWDQLREDFRVTFKDGMRAALDGDFGEFLASRVEEAFIKGLDDSLDQMADALFNLIREAWSKGSAGAGGAGGGSEGGGWMSAVGDFIGSIFGGGGGGSSGASAHMSAGRATGGPVYRGDTRMVGEQGLERYSFGADGYVHDAATTARQMADGAGAPTASSDRAAGGVVVNLNNQSGVQMGARVKQTPEPGGGQRLDVELFRMIDTRIDERFDASLKGGRDDQVRAREFGQRRQLRGG